MHPKVIEFQKSLTGGKKVLVGRLHKGFDKVWLPWLVYRDGCSYELLNVIVPGNAPSTDCVIVESPSGLDSCFWDSMYCAINSAESSQYNIYGDVCLITDYTDKSVNITSRLTDYTVHYNCAELVYLYLRVLNCDQSALDSWYTSRLAGITDF